MFEEYSADYDKKIIDPVTESRVFESQDWNFVEVDRDVFEENIFGKSDPFTVYELRKIADLDRICVPDLLYGNQPRVKNISGFKYESFISFSRWGRDDCSPTVYIDEMLLGRRYHSITIIKGDDLYFWVFDWNSYMGNSSCKYYKCDDISGVIRLFEYLNG